MSLKKQLIKNYLKMQLISSMPGELRIKVTNLPKLSQEYLEFAPYVYEFIKLKDGIKDVKANFATGEVTIYYNSTMQPQEIIMWINTIMDVAIEQMDMIADKWDANKEEVINTLKRILIGKMF
nr:hypothetical protein [uncultured Niameybacter sp.]